jgi:MFS family permease
MSSIEPLDYERAEPKRWSVGTLTYTTSGLVILFCWLLWGDFAYMMKERTAISVVQLMIKKFGASDFLQSLYLIALPAAMGVLIGPIVSYHSDRTRSRWGRRIPYLLAVTPFAVLAMVGMAFTPMLGHALHWRFGVHLPAENQIILILFGLFWGSFDIATVTANLVFYGLINDVVPSQFLGRFFGLFRALSLIAGIIFNAKLLGLAEAHYLAIFIGVGLLYGLGFTVMCFKVKEGNYPPPTDLAESQKPGLLHAIRLYGRECFANPYYRWVIAGYTLCMLSNIPINLYTQPFAKSLNVNMTSFGRMLALTYLISLIMSYPLGALADRFHPLRAGIIAQGLYMLVAFWGGIYAHNATNFAIALIGHGVLSGVFFTTTASITQRLFPKSRYAQFYSAAWLLYSVSQVLFIPIVGKYLDYTQHDYRQTFLISGVIALLGTLTLIETYRRFNTFGGVRNYVAPEE